MTGASLASTFSFSERIKLLHENLFVDAVFNEQRWKDHRSTWKRHRIENYGLRTAAVFAGFFWQILLIEFVAVLVCIYSTVLVRIGCPPIPSSFYNVFALLTFSLSLLLVFKTNSSFSRWWEGRVVWGQLVNFARNYARHMISNLPEDGSRKLKQAAIRWACASLHVLKGYIQQKGKDSYLEAAHLLNEDELLYLSKWSVNPPTGCSAMLSAIVNEAAARGLHPIQRSQIEAEVSLYVNMAGACERIYKTPIPAAYTRHTSRFLMTFLFFSPIMLWGSTGYATLVIMPIVSFLLIGIENIGVQIEGDDRLALRAVLSPDSSCPFLVPAEPFRILPLQSICSGIDSNLREMEQLSELAFDLKSQQEVTIKPQGNFNVEC